MTRLIEGRTPEETANDYAAELGLVGDAARVVADAFIAGYLVGFMSSHSSSTASLDEFPNGDDDDDDDELEPRPVCTCQWPGDVSGFNGPEGIARAESCPMHASSMRGRKP